MKKLLLFASLACTLLGSCDFVGREQIKGNGNIKTEERTVSSFNHLQVHGGVDVYVIQGRLQPIRIEGDENLIQYIELIEEGDELTVRNKDDFNLKPTRDLKIYVTAPSYESIDVSGACNIFGQTKISGSDDLDLRVSGAGEIKMEVDVPKIQAKISGSGTVGLKGETEEFELSLSGAANAHCYELLSEYTNVEISGAGDAEVYASQKLKVKVSGAGNVSYKGNARNVSQDVSGAGSVRKVGD